MGPEFPQECMVSLVIHHENRKRRFFSGSALFGDGKEHFLPQAIEEEKR
jgi:hypothetical protein